MPIDTAYPLSNADVQAGARMDVLSRLYDATTRRVIDATGLAPGWRCLEVGGGGGSVARWLAGRVGAAGSVLCTDIDTRIIERGRAIAERHSRGDGEHAVSHATDDDDVIELAGPCG